MQERIGLILVDVYKMQKFQRNHSGVLPCPYRGEPWDRGWQMEHTTWRRTSLVLFDNAVGTFFRSAPLRNGDWVNLFDRRNFVRHCSFLDNGSLITSLFNYFLLQWSPARHVGQLENQDWTELNWTGLLGGIIAFSTFPLQTRFFHLGEGGRRVVLIYIDFTFLLVCLLVLNWSLCLTHGRHVSLESWKKKWQEWMLRRWK